MKKPFLLIPIFLLSISACSLNKEDTGEPLSDEEASQLIAQIEKKSSGLQKNSYRFEYEQSETIHSEDNKFLRDKYSIVYSSNTNEEFYYSWNFEEGNQKETDGNVTKVKDEKYEEVTACVCNLYDENGQKESYFNTVIKKDNDDFDYQYSENVEKYMMGFSNVANIMQNCSNINNFSLERIKQLATQYESKSYSINATYSGDVNKGNIYIKCLTEPIKGASLTDTRFLMKAEETISFTNYQFASFSSNNQYSDGSKYIVSAKMTYMDYKYNLPKNWKEHIVEQLLKEYPINEINQFLTSHGATTDVPNLAYEGARYKIEINNVINTFNIYLFSSDLDAAFSYVCAQFPEDQYSYMPSYYSDSKEVFMASYNSKNQNVDFRITHGSQYLYIVFDPR